MLIYSMLYIWLFKFMKTSTLIKKTSRLLIKKANDLLKPYGITHAYTYFLVELYKQEGVTQAEMSKRIGIEQPTAVRTLDRMERDGFIMREQSSMDRRVVLIRLTDKGKQCQSTILRCAEQLNEVALKGFTQNDHLLLMQLLTQVISNLEAD
ncbi:transcriptional regulator [Legionella oakridgensis RV-2-2007]|nr:transcriptional regulator [Legionella oakridgensis RV-2-2007]